VFRYNANEDRLELCLEPYGHFPVEPRIEEKVKAAGMEGSKEDTEVKFGASGAIHHGTERPAFLGEKFFYVKLNMCYYNYERNLL
jgi:deubiquitinating protein VCIP135